MMNVKENIRTSFLICILSLLIITCKKNNIGESRHEETVEDQIDLSVKVTASVSGYVTNESDAAVEGASVLYGASVTTTNKYGYFEIKNAIVTQNAAFVTVTGNGYFKGIKTLLQKRERKIFAGLN